MRVTLSIEDTLWTHANELTGIADRNALVRAGLTALIQRESARRLARLGGSEPDLRPTPRRRPPRR